MAQRDQSSRELYTPTKMDYGLGNQALAFKHRDTPPPMLKSEYSTMKCPTKELLDIWWQNRLNRDLQKVALIIGTGTSPSEVYRDFTETLYRTVKIEIVPSLYRMKKSQNTI